MLGCCKIKKIGPGWNLKTDLFDHKFNILINWLCEESPGIPKKDVVMGTSIFLLNENTLEGIITVEAKEK